LESAVSAEIRFTEIETSDDSWYLLDFLISFFWLLSNRAKKGKGSSYLRPSWEDMQIKSNNSTSRPCLRTQLFSKVKACWIRSRSQYLHRVCIDSVVRICNVFSLMIYFYFRGNKMSKLNHSGKRRGKLSSSGGWKEYL
jgi:hypothetical protein